MLSLPISVCGLWLYSFNVYCFQMYTEPLVKYPTSSLVTCPLASSSWRISTIAVKLGRTCGSCGSVGWGRPGQLGHRVHEELSSTGHLCPEPISLIPSAASPPLNPGPLSLPSAASTP